MASLVIKMRFFTALLLLFSSLALRGEIYDCFTFFNELELLKIRFEELYDVVDHFVLVEATHTFAGQPKPLYFSENAHLFEKYKQKIICVVVNDFPAPSADLAGDRWVREEFQRNAMLRGLNQCKNEDIILISDVDEIPSQHAIEEISNYFQTPKSFLKENQFVCSLNMRLFLFYLNRESALGWKGGSKAAPYWLVKKRSPWNIKILHLYDSNLPLIEKAGWHFHSMGGRDSVLEKLKAIYLYDETAFISPSDLKKIAPNLVPETSSRDWPSPIEIANDPDIFKAWVEAVYGVKTVIIDASFPKYLVGNIDYYKSLEWF